MYHNRFYDMSTDLLETLYKMEEYLKKRSKNEAHISGEVSDTAKIVRQVYIMNAYFRLFGL